MTRLFIATFSLILLAPHATAEPGDPLAIRMSDPQSFVLQWYSGERVVFDDTAHGSIASIDSIEGVASTSHSLFSDASTPAIEVRADGLSVLWLTSDRLGKTVSDEALRGLEIDVVIAADVDRNRNNDAALTKLLTVLCPGTLIVTGPYASDLDAMVDLADKAGRTTNVRRVDHNTIAGQRRSSGDDSILDIVTLEPIDWWDSADAQLKTLFDAMTKSCSDSQAVFATLSTEQMNFRPSNGTHTPRWNIEHMRGRQLLFFSQIFHEVDSAIPVMDLNPKQMPSDYDAAHPDWDGAREALEAKRVNDFCVRFAYLLDGISLDDKAPGSRWTLRKLLRQMDRHYTEHTTNTIKKFESTDWPAWGK